MKYPCLPLISIGSRAREIKLRSNCCTVDWTQKVSKKLTDKQTWRWLKWVVIFRPIRGNVDICRARRYGTGTFSHIRRMIAASITYRSVLQRVRRPYRWSTARDRRLHTRCAETANGTCLHALVHRHCCSRIVSSRHKMANGNCAIQVVHAGEKHSLSLISLQFYQNDNIKKQLEGELEGTCVWSFSSSVVKA